MPAPRAWFVDADGDGAGDWSVRWYSAIDTTQPAGHADNRWDCDDSDASVNALTAESCTDGRDNDCDGLLDCEDDDCETDSSCVELGCDDDLDDDDDGKVDCSDDDCWGTAACLSAVTIRSRVRSGQLHVDTNASVNVQACQYGASSTGVDRVSSWRDTAHAIVRASNVEGTVVIETSAGTSTCDWGFSVGWWRATEQWKRMTGELMVAPDALSGDRTGFWIDAGCAVSTSGFLPSRWTQSSDFFLRGATGGWYAPLDRWRRSGTGDEDYFSEYDPLGDGVAWSCGGSTATYHSYLYGTLATGDTFSILVE